MTVVYRLVKTLKFFVLLLVFSCTSSALPPRDDTHNSNFVPARYLIFIGFDGWGASYIDKANMPTIKRMILDGTSSTAVYSVMPSTSWPNWTSIFMGTPPEKRTENDFPSIFSLVEDSFSISQTNFESNRAILFYEWKELYNICSDKDAIKLSISSDYASAYRIASYIVSEKPVFTAVVFGEPDTTGHMEGWGSEAYYSKLSLLDDFVSIIEQAVKESDIYDSTVFVFSSDHGGSFKGHGLNTSKHRKVPLIFFGPGLKKGYTIPFHLDICDIAPSMAAILGIQLPKEWTGRPIFEIFN